MKKFSILHLSDLHLNAKANQQIYSNLIEDIQGQTEDLDSIVIVVTGDCVDRAEFNGDNLVIAVDFFARLNVALSGKIKHVFFTAGNHDKKRIEFNQSAQNHFCGKKYSDLDTKFEQGDWKTVFRHTFDEYIGFIEMVNNATGWHVPTELYFCDIFEINGCTVRLNVLNSALTSFNDNDYGELRIGKFQIDKVNQDYLDKQASFGPIDITLTIMHHPTYWICKEEYDEFLDNIISKNSLATDVLLRGHTHDKGLENYYRTTSSFTTLVTGVGNNLRGNDQRYSIYNFICDRNLIEVIMRIYTDNGFQFDFAVYLDSAQAQGKKIMYFPMKVHEYLSTAYLYLPLVNKTRQPMLPSKEVLARIVTVSEQLLQVKKSALDAIWEMRKDFLSKVKEPDGDLPKFFEDFIMTPEKFATSSSMSAFLTNYLAKTQQPVTQQLIDETEIKKIKEAVKQKINSNYALMERVVCNLLHSFCRRVTDILFSGLFNESEKVRAQFRVLHINDKKYYGYTAFPRPLEEDTVVNVTPIKWGDGLVKSSFDSKSLLVYSSNQPFVSDARLESSEWSDYLTYAPSFAFNTYTDENGDGYPIFTFGINSNINNVHHIFEALSFLPLKKIIDDVMLEIYNTFHTTFDVMLDITANKISAGGTVK